MRCCDIHLIAIPQKILQLFIVEMGLNFINLTLLSNLSWTNELKYKLMIKCGASLTIWVELKQLSHSGKIIVKAIYTIPCLIWNIQRQLITVMEPTTVGSRWLENDLHENGLNWNHIYRKIEKKCPRYFRWDSRKSTRSEHMYRTGRSAALSRGRKSMPPIWVEKRVHETRCVTAWIYVNAQ